MSTPDLYDVLIIGGGYSGGALAVRLAREAKRPLSIAVIEPREEVGRGVAYSAAHPDHRLNGPDLVHIAVPDEPDDFPKWVRSEGLLESDPEAVVNGGPVFARRADFGRYMAELFETHRNSNPSCSDITHMRLAATGLHLEADGVKVTLEDGQELSGRQAVLATSNETPAVPALLRDNLQAHPGFLPNPWDLDRIKSLDPETPVLVLGTGLTAADVIVTLANQGHRAPIDAVSRRGLLPSGQNPSPDRESMWQRFTRTPPRFVERYGMPDRVSDIMACLRKDIAALEAEGKPWHNAFDDLRDAARTLWPNMPLKEQLRFQRHLKPWYETRRFRIAPQIMDVLEAKQSQGQLTIQAGRITGVQNDGEAISVAVQPRGESSEVEKTYGALINCTGPSANPAASGNPVMMQIVSDGLAAPNPNGQGFLVDEECRAVSVDGAPQDRLRVLGPLTRGCFLESGSVPTVSYYIYKMMPGFLAGLDAG